MTKFRILQRQLTREKTKYFFKENGDKKIEDCETASFFKNIIIPNDKFIFVKDLKGIFSLSVDFKKSARKDTKFKKFVRNFRYKKSK